MYTDLYSKMDNAHWTMAQMANEHWPFCCINRYTSDTHGVKAFQSYTALYSAIQYTAIQLYIAIHYTPSTTPLCLEREGDEVGPRRRIRNVGCEQAQRLVRAAELAARGGDAQIGEDLEHPSVVARLQLQETLWELALSELRLNRGLIGVFRRTNLVRWAAGGCAGPA